LPASTAETRRLRYAAGPRAGSQHASDQATKDHQTSAVRVIFTGHAPAGQPGFRVQSEHEGGRHPQHVRMLALFEELGAFLLAGFA
jgi:hypothetical protein